jgi:hypothetical protein
MTTFNREQAEEAFAIQFFNEIARQCGCTCTVDFSEKTVYFHGSDESRDKVLAALEKILH